MSILNRYGSNDAGALIETVVISSLQVTQLFTYISDVTIATSGGAVDSEVKIQTSTDNAVWSTISKVTEPGDNTKNISLESPLPVNQNEWLRVVFIQGTASSIAVTLNGETRPNNIISSEEV